MARAQGRKVASRIFARWAIVAVFVGVSCAALASMRLADSDALASQISAKLRAATNAPDAKSRGVEFSAARNLIRKELALSPGKSAAWARLAYAQSLQAGRLTPEAAKDLMRSYKAAPHDADLVLWRTAFVYRNWTTAPLELRVAAFDEVTAFRQFPLHRDALQRLPEMIGDPSGRFALILALEGGADS